MHVHEHTHRIAPDPAHALAVADSPRRRAVLFGLLKANRYGRSVADKDFVHEISRISSLVPEPRWMYDDRLDNMFETVQQLVDEGVISMIAPRPLSGRVHHWRVTDEQLTLRDMGQAILDADFGDVLSQMTPDHIQLMRYAVGWGPSPTELPFHDGTKFVGETAYLIELGLVRDDMEHALKDTMRPLKSTPRADLMWQIMLEVLDRPYY